MLLQIIWTTDLPLIAVPPRIMILHPRFGDYAGEVWDGVTGEIGAAVIYLGI